MVLGGKLALIRLVTLVWTHFKPFWTLLRYFWRYKRMYFSFEGCTTKLEITLFTLSHGDSLVELNWTVTQFILSLEGTGAEQQFQGSQELKLWTKFIWKVTYSTLGNRSIWLFEEGTSISPTTPTYPTNYTMRRSLGYLNCVGLLMKLQNCPLVGLELTTQQQLCQNSSPI